MAPLGALSQAWVTDGVEFCSCPGVTWLNRDATTSRPCRTCGKLRPADVCIVGSDNPKHRREGCRSTHILRRSRRGLLPPVRAY
jgi:hypothetical protein